MSFLTEGDRMQPRGTKLGQEMSKSGKKEQQAPPRWELDLDEGGFDKGKGIILTLWTASRCETLELEEEEGRLCLLRRLDDKQRDRTRE